MFAGVTSAATPRTRTPELMRPSARAAAAALGIPSAASASSKSHCR